MLRVMKKNGNPKYIQIRDAILHDIRSGKLPPGSKLPRRENLIEKYSVARATMNKAITDLINAGVLTALRKRGTFVANADSRAETALVCDLKDVGYQSGKNMLDDIGRNIFSYILTHAPKHLRLSVIDCDTIQNSEELERYRKVVMLMPLKKELDIARKLCATEVCVINRSVPGFNCVSTDHRSATRDVTGVFLDELGSDCQVFFLDMTDFSQVIRNERREGFIEACEKHQIFYRIISGTGFDIVEPLLKQQIIPGKKIVIVSGSRFLTGPVFKYSILKGLTFGKDIFYSDFDNFDSKIYFGEPIISIVQNYTALGQAAIDFLTTHEHEKNTSYIPFRLIGKDSYFPKAKK